MDRPMRTIGDMVRERCRMDLPCARKDKEEANDGLLQFDSSTCPRKDAKEAVSGRSAHLQGGFLAHVQWAGLRQKIFLGAGECAEKTCQSMTIFQGPAQLTCQLNTSHDAVGAERGSSVPLGPWFGLASGSQECNGPCS